MYIRVCVFDCAFVCVFDFAFVCLCLIVRSCVCLIVRPFVCLNIWSLEMIPIPVMKYAKSVFK